MMSGDFTTAIENLVRKAQAGWLTSACEALRSLPATANSELVLQRLPATANADASFLMTAAVRLASGQMSWEALSWTLETTSISFHRLRAEQHIELLWSGPSPTNQIPARRIDQALYDLIANAKREILMVTFAATKIERLTGELWKAAGIGVKIRLILEFEESSGGQLSYDALRAFPAALVHASEIYQWPVEKRERNQAGRPGKLHAKVAIVDDTALVSSANLTDDAFTRNFEVGLLVKNTEFLTTVKGYFDSLIAAGTLSRLHGER
ncbi:MAG: phospholipase [Rhodospirillaceae bacterium]|nr:phospholipase [Rhodospirillaceae bacterium]